MTPEDIRAIGTAAAEGGREVFVNFARRPGQLGGWPVDIRTRLAYTGIAALDPRI